MGKLRRNLDVISNRNWCLHSWCFTYFRRSAEWVRCENGVSGYRAVGIKLYLLRSIDVALTVYPGGWFAAETTIESYYADRGVLVLRAMGHRPVDVPVTGEDPIVFVEEVVLVPEDEYVITG